jgi:carbon-monoxide dehydrogenase large subunit
VVETLTPSGAPGVYKVRSLAWTTYGVYTNKVPVGPYRGYGQHATSYFVERVMDLIASKLQLDPVEIRRRNFISSNAFPYRTPIGTVYDSGDYETALAQALQLAGYSALRDQQKRLRGQGKLMGIGIATTVDASGFGPASGLSARPGFETATVRVDASARVTVLTGASPHGQGHETTFAQIAADELSVPFADVDVVYGDTSIVPQGVGTRASRSLVVGGTAIVHACRRVKAKATELAAGLLQIDPQHVALEDGKFFVEDIPGRYLSWPEVCRAAYGIPNPPRSIERGLEATAYWEPPAYTYPYSANVAVVRIDEDTGEVQLTGYTSVDDCGTVINPLVVDGQVHGGLAQGIGAALLEEAVWNEDGQLVTGSFMDYAMPLAGDFPMFTLGRTVTPSPHNPLGAKGMGESATVAAVPAVVNAVVDALAHLGVTHLDIPIKPEKVWRLLKDKGPAA